MGQWQITKGTIPTGEVFDDSSFFSPGEDGFSSDAVAAHVAALGTGRSFNYVGRSTSPVLDAERVAHFEPLVLPDDQSY